MSRYRLTVDGDRLVATKVPDGPFPLRAQGFLHFDPKEHVYSELMLDVKDGKVLAWVAPVRAFAPKGKPKEV